MARKSRKHLQTEINRQYAPTSCKVYIAGIYARTSSKDKSEDSIENQKKIAEEYILSKPDIQFSKIYIDFGVSSFAHIRPGFEDMINDIESKIINCVVVKDISRFSRERLEAGDFLERKFPKWGVRFISINDNFDSLYNDATQIGIILRSLMNYNYSLDLSRKIQSVVKMRLETGDYIPARLPYGYKKVFEAKSVRWGLDENAAPKVKKIFELALSGISAYSIASKLNNQNIPSPGTNLWTSRSILRILKNKAYTGTFITGKTRNDLSSEQKTESLPPERWIRHRNHHMPIADEITFITVQHSLSERQMLIQKHGQIPDFFEGKLYCGLYGRKIKQKRAANGSVYYICPRRDESASSCPNKAINERKLKKQVYLVLLDKINEHKTHCNEIIEYEKTPYFQRKESAQNSLLQKYENELEYQNQLFITLYEGSVNNQRTRSADFRGLMTYLRRVRATLEKQISELKNSKEEYQKNKISDSEKALSYLPFLECSEITEEMVSKMIERIYVNVGSVSLDLK